MEEIRNAIKCPKCGDAINVNEIIFRELEAEIKAKSDAAMTEERKKINSQLSDISTERKKMEDEKRSLKSAIETGIRSGIIEEKKKFEDDIKKKVEIENSDRFNLMEKELNEKSKQLQEFNRAKAEIERLKREKEEIESSLTAKLETRYNEKIKEEKSRLLKEADGKMELKIAEKDKLIEQLNNQMKEAQRKAEQGSMQMQGEVQETAIEAWLKEQFPLDSIDEVKKGARGADCLQTINTETRRSCGSIYYESKRTKSFQQVWIEKFKNDIREKGADIGVLITEALPSDMPRMGRRDGVWICTFEEFKALCHVLRESLIRLNDVLAANENKGDKMVMLYDFLTGNEFRMQVEAIVEGFAQMKADLESEKRAMTGIWKQREKQIDKVILNTTFMYSSIKGIAGSAIQSVKQLELPVGDGE